MIFETKAMCAMESDKEASIVVYNAILDKIILVVCIEEMNGCFVFTSDDEGIIHSKFIDNKNFVMDIIKEDHLKLIGVL